jgi:hypothetical protein
LSKFVFCYFKKWKNVNKLYKIKIKSKLKDLVNQRYKQLMASYYFSWNKHKDGKV